MDRKEILHQLESILDTSKVGILATTDKDGRAAMRWMTPALIQGQTSSLFTVKSS